MGRRSEISQSAEGQSEGSSIGGRENHTSSPLPVSGQSCWPVHISGHFDGQVSTHNVVVLQLHWSRTIESEEGIC